ncbi:hypothetical protein BDB01DRAFT_838578 [Pilobolus umbonatus]|nr:hypothetical protein BDB01DRAFT_838578 [Pilobolus umbonatus]
MSISMHLTKTEICDRAAFRAVIKRSSSDPSRDDGAACTGVCSYLRNSVMKECFFLSAETAPMMEIELGSSLRHGTVKHSYRNSQVLKDVIHLIYQLIYGSRILVIEVGLYLFGLPLLIQVQSFLGRPIALKSESGFSFQALYRLRLQVEL